MKKLISKPSRSEANSFYKVVNSIIVMVIIGTLLFGAGAFTRAQEGEQDFTLDASSKCVENIRKFGAEKQVAFGNFINTHFRSAKPTSELIPVAIERYRQYRGEIRAEIARILDAEKKDKKDPQVVLRESAACESAVKEDFDLMKQMIRQHVVENAYAKKATRLSDKLKSINEKLGVLNATVSQMYGYFGGFSQKLPCYATQCIKR